MSNWTITEALYHAYGKPDLDRDVTFTNEKICGNCHQRRTTVPAHKILTSQFGTWEDITTATDGKRWLCLPCSWTYREASLRRQTTLITAEGTATRLNTTETRSVLSGPIANNTALVIPVSGKKIVAPKAQWGHIATDRGVLYWTPRHAKTLQAAAKLRDMGFTEASLKEPSPPFGIIAQKPLDQHAIIRNLWGRVRTAQEDKALFPLILFASRKAPKK